MGTVTDVGCGISLVDVCHGNFPNDVGTITDVGYSDYPVGPSAAVDE